MFLSPSTRPHPLNSMLVVCDDSLPCLVGIGNDLEEECLLPSFV